MILYNGALIKIAALTLEISNRMKLIVGLGNPGTRYEKTRHNVGFMLLDEIINARGLTFSKSDKFKAKIAELQIGGNKILLVKPLTFMNNSGESVATIKSFYKLKNENILIIHDEVDIAFRKIKISNNSGSAGHKGVESIIKTIDKDFNRLRIGIDNRENRNEAPTEKYVLDKFNPEEQITLRAEILPEAFKKVFSWLK